MHVCVRAVRQQNVNKIHNQSVTQYGKSSDAVQKLTLLNFPDSFRHRAMICDSASIGSIMHSLCLFTSLHTLYVYELKSLSHATENIWCPYVPLIY